MKALSVRQPWCDLIRTGTKTIEIRSWPTRHRGLLAICASACPSGTLPVGCVRAVVTLTDCRPMRPEDAEAAGCDYDPDAWSWVLTDACPVDPSPAVKGRLGIYELAPGIDLGDTEMTTTEHKRQITQWHVPP